MALPLITASGNLTADPELKFGASGVAMCKLRVACGDRKKNPTTGEWEDGDTTFINVTAWRQLAENCADSLQKGSSVTITGKLKSRTYEDAEGQQKTIFEVDADTVAVNLNRASVKVSKTAAPYNSGTANDGWSNPTPTALMADVPF